MLKWASVIFALNCTLFIVNCLLRFHTINVAIKRHNYCDLILYRQIFFSRNTGTISTKMRREQPWVKGTKSFTNACMNHLIFKNEIVRVFPLFVNVLI